MKLILKNNIETFRERYVNEKDMITQHYYFNYLLIKNGIQIKGNNSGNYYMLMKTSLNKPRKGKPNIMEHPERIYYNELFYPDDWITEGDDMRQYLLNPYIRESTYSILEYDEIKRKNFLIISYAITGNRLFKNQRVAYLLYHRSFAFPNGAMIVQSKPSDITIRYNSRRNMIRLEGANCVGKWTYFDRIKE